MLLIGTQAPQRRSIVIARSATFSRERSAAGRGNSYGANAPGPEPAENVPLGRGVFACCEREMKPHVPEAIDADLKAVTTRIKQMIEELSA